jgi:N-acetylmuramoyl-L-alanine amidase
MHIRTFVFSALILLIITSFIFFPRNNQNEKKSNYIDAPISFKNSDTITIVEKKINYDEERIRLGIQYLKDRHGLDQKKPTITPKMVVLHYTEGGTIKSIYNYFNKTYIENGRSFNKNQSQLNVSSHYLIDRDGTIYHLVADTLFARHAIGINYCSIGVENIGSKENPLTEKQVVANANLVRYLCKKYKIEYLIGHSEYKLIRNTSLWKETNPNYFTYKSDPGDEFMSKVRKLTLDLKLKSKP